MSALGPAARALLEAVDGVDGASAGDKERVRAQLALRVGLAAVGAATAASAASAQGSVVVSATAATAGGKAAALAGTGGVALAWKLIGAAGLVGAIVVGAVSIRHDDGSRGVSSRTKPTASAASAGGSSFAPVSAGSTAGAPETAPGVEGEAMAGPATEPASSAAAARGHLPVGQGGRVGGPGAPGSAPASGAAASSSGPTGAASAPALGEAALLRNAEVAIAAGDGVGALALLDMHAKRYPDGALADQRDAERVVALCTVGRVPAAREAAARFLAAHPRSSKADRVRRACGTP